MSDATQTPDAHADKVREAPARAWLIRFAFGAAVSALAGVVTQLAGPKVGGLFLAFPAILLASITLVAREEGERRAREDARGATLGATGLIGFAAVVAVTTPRWPVWATLLAATAAWAVVSGLAYLATARRTGEPDGD